ncbi:MAG TPA: hypothetical protein VEM96_18200 [Pyrinomonadaceae bacterium]|nr:hypothetical protein [Pyrinomonadaceae bacterium]
MNRKYRALLIGTLSLILVVLVNSCQPSPPGNTNAPSPTASPTASPIASPNASPGATPDAGKTGTRGPHCDDPPPANPSNCTPPIDQPFVVGCTLPIPGGQSHDIDLHCPNEGCATRERDKAQNRIKNNLCSVGPAIQISTTSIDKLQASVDQLVAQHSFSYGQSPPEPADRAKLHDLSTVDVNGNAVLLGEGKLVTFEGFVLDAKHDDTYLQGSGPQGFKGEGVNCKNSLLEWNDIHVALTETPGADECSSVTAEIIPHFRPALWERFDSNACTSPHVTNPLPIKNLRVRITGQLFFDGSHTAGACGVAPGVNSFQRRSVWEVHPVYAIEVFDTAKNKFVTLEEWAQGL